jgi:hypothetical protein
MPIGFTNTAGGSGYIDVRVGDDHNIHEVLLDASNLAGARDADGYLPPGLPVNAAGQLVLTTVQVYGYIGPEAVKLGSANIFANIIRAGGLNRDAIEDNLGRALNAAELALPPTTITMY